MDRIQEIQKRIAKAITHGVMSAPDLTDIEYLLAENKRLTETLRNAVNDCVHMSQYHVLDTIYQLAFESGEVKVTKKDFMKYMGLREEETPMINWCEHGNMLVCEECAKKNGY